MKRTTRQFIRGLRKTFRETDKKGREEIWDILTALRGPDDGSSTSKNAATCVIRYNVFGKKAMHGFPAMIHNDSQLDLNNRKTMAGSYHFKSHAENAFKALGLNWNEVNEVNPVNE
jgi:hypothetical protein